MKHGVIILKHKDWNTKQVWNQGDLMITYGQQPKKLHFENRMVNDANQDLCGGWMPLDSLEEDTSIDDPALRQLLSYLKPLGFICESSKKEAEQTARELRQMHEDFDVKVLPPGPHRLNHTIAIATQKGTLREIFDLDSLYRDYLENDVIPKKQLDREFSKYGDRTLISFAGKFDIDEGIPPWVTGLILGYPVENTISLYRGYVD